MKRITLNQLLTTIENLQGDCFPIYITNPKMPLQSHCTTKLLVNMTSLKTNKIDKILYWMSQYSSMFKKSFIYVDDSNYVKYF